MLSLADICPLDRIRLVELDWMPLFSFKVLNEILLYDFKIEKIVIFNRKLLSFYDKIEKQETFWER